MSLSVKSTNLIKHGCYKPKVNEEFNLKYVFHLSQKIRFKKNFVFEILNKYFDKVQKEV